MDPNLFHIDLERLFEVLTVWSATLASALA